jgi:hypothetical protein
MWFAQDTIYYTTTSTDVSTGSAALGLGLFMTIFLVSLVPAIVMIVAMWKIFEKAGQPGWAAIVPFYNFYILLQIVGRPTWWVAIYLLMFIPFVNFIAWIGLVVIWILVALDLGKAFGKDQTWSIIWLILLSFIGMLILGFGKDKYLGAPNTPPKA